jgi:hypothetical protein
LHFIRQIGITPNPGVVRSLADTEKLPIEQLIVSADGDDMDEFPQARVRALMTALLGTGPGMKGGPYKLLKFLRIWKSKIGDEGVAAIVSSLFFTILRIFKAR